MIFTVYCRYGHNRRFSRVWTTQDGKRADLIATNETKHDVVKAVKVVCFDGSFTETLIYK